MAFDKDEVIGENTVTTSQLQQAVAAVWAQRAAYRGAVKTAIDAIRAKSNEGRFGGEVENSAAESLRKLEESYKAEGKRILDPVMRHIQILAGVSRPGDVRNNWPAVYLYLQKQGLTFLRRGPAYATSVSNTEGKGSMDAIVGDSQFYSLAVDRYGNPLDDGDKVTYTVRCFADRWTLGEKRLYSERFLWTPDTERDTIFEDGHDGRIAFEPYNGQGLPNSGGFVKNGSFGKGGETDSDPQAIQDWNDDAGYGSSRYAFVDTAAAIYRKDRTELINNKALALEILDTGTLYQDISGLPTDRPILLGAYVQRVATSGRTIKLKLGALEIEEDFTSGWSSDEAQLLVATLDENLYLDNIQGDGTQGASRLQIIVSGGSGGDKARVDNVFIEAPFRLNNRWAWHLPGQTAHLRDDQFQVIDGAPATNGRIATVVDEIYGLSLPVVASTPTVIDPT